MYILCVFACAPGYAIFVVIGELVECEADQLLMLRPAVQPIKPRLIADTAATRKSYSHSTTSTGDTGSTLGGSFSEDDLARALVESRRLVDAQDPSLHQVLNDSRTQAQQDEGALQRALAMSMEGGVIWLLAICTHCTQCCISSVSILLVMKTGFLDGSINKR